MKRTIYLNSTTAALLNVDDGGNISERIAQMAQAYAQACDAGQIPRAEPDALASALVRYRAMLDAAAPALSVGEWALLCDALNGGMLTAAHADSDPALTLAAMVRDLENSALEEKWDIDTVYLASRLSAMSYPALCSVIETVARFWQQSGQRIADIETLLRTAGAKVASGEDIAAG